MASSSGPSERVDRVSLKRPSDRIARVARACAAGLGLAPRCRAWLWLALAASGCAPDGAAGQRATPAGQPIDTLVEILAELPDDSDGVCSFGTGAPVWLTPDYRQHLYVSTGPDGSELSVVDSHLDERTGDWTFISHAAFSTLPFSGVASAGADRFCFAGCDAADAFVLEIWSLVHDGALAGESAATAPLEAGRPAKRFEARRIHAGPLVDGILAIEFDAEARFVLALLRVGEERVLYRFENEPGATPTLLAHSAELPELARMTSLRILQHRRLGRVWLLDDDVLAPAREIAFLDAQNDGVFDGPPVVGSPHELARLGLHESSQYVSLLSPAGR